MCKDLEVSYKKSAKGTRAIHPPHEGGGISHKYDNIPLSDALRMSELHEGRTIVKTRNRVAYRKDDLLNLCWEVDVFKNMKGLIIAEIEIPNEDYPLILPPWIGEEITDRKDLSNAALSREGSEWHD